MDAYQESLARAVGEGWQKIVSGAVADDEEFSQERERRDSARKKEFQEAIKAARKVGVSWAAMARFGVSRPTLYKYGKGNGE